MAKKKSSKKTNSLIMKGVTALSSVLVLVFMFLNELVIKVKSSTLITKESTTKTEVSFFKVLFNEDYASLRENFSLTTTIMWIVFVLAVVSLVAAVLAFVASKGALLSKVSGVLLVLAMLLLFVVNFEKNTVDLYVAKGETSVSNITVLYFVSLVFSGLGLVSSLNVKD